MYGRYNNIATKRSNNIFFYTRQTFSFSAYDKFKIIEKVFPTQNSTNCKLYLTSCRGYNLTEYQNVLYIANTQ